MAERVLSAVEQIPNAKVAVLGLAFKNGTDDCRESPAMEIIAELLAKKANIVAYDPKAMDTAKVLLGDKIGYAADMYSALEGADVLAVLTEWNEFKELDLDRAAKLMNHKNIVDCRNMISRTSAQSKGFKYKGIGK